MESSGSGGPPPVMGPDGFMIAAPPPAVSATRKAVIFTYDALGRLIEKASTSPASRRAPTATATMPLTG
jgi:YD repeat-containing protein